MVRHKRGAQHQLRIIGGKWKGRKVSFAGDASLRPTLGRIRETLFNWIRADVANAQVLDAFAGSGALGLEALSVGAAHTTFVERNRRACVALRNTIDTLQAQDCSTLVCADILQHLRRSPAQFDIVLLDPPYDRNDLLHETLCQTASTHLPPHGLVFAEFDRIEALESAASDAGLEIFKTSRAGETHAVLMRPIAGDARQR